MFYFRSLTLFVACSAIAGAYSSHFTTSFSSTFVAIPEYPAGGKEEFDRSPVEFVLTPDECSLISVNQTSGTVSLVDVATGKIRAELPCGERPSGIATSVDGKRICVTATFSGELFLFAHESNTLRPIGSVDLGFEPRGVVMSHDGTSAYVALSTAHQIAVVNLANLSVQDRIAVKRWPRYLALAPDGNRLAVGCSGDGAVCVVDMPQRKMLFCEEFNGLNIGEMQISTDGKFAYVPWIAYRQNPITSDNIKRGWVLASRAGRIRLDEKMRREAVSLDTQGKAVSDPHGLALSPNEKTLVLTASGTHELLVLSMEKLPWQDYGGTDHLPATLQNDKSRFDRIELGGRPMQVKYSKDNSTVYVANYLSNSVQVVDVPKRKVLRSIPLGNAPQPTLSRQGEAIFYDGRRSLDQWYSCHSCHYEGNTNSITMDTINDGRFGTFKTVLSLRNSAKTAPYFWHGWQPDLALAVKKSMIDTMIGPVPSEQDVKAVTAFVESLKMPRNPFRSKQGKLSASAERGTLVFKSDKAACASCHAGPMFTDRETYDVGTESNVGKYHGFNPPSLVGVYDRMMYLHDGRAESLEQLLKGDHSPRKVTGHGDLTADELADLIAYLRTL